MNVEGEQMEQSRHGEDLPTPEQREILRINSIVIPADENQSLQRGELPREGLTERQQLVGGLIQGINLDEPAARLYCNEDGKYMGLPPNKRATLLLWMHNPRFRGQDFIVGDAFVVGPAKRSADSSVPDEYVQTLFEATSFHVELKPPGSDEWQQHPQPFDDWVTAYENAIGWSRGVSGQGIAVRVVPEI
jgi:hypothetical protein